MKKIIFILFIFFVFLFSTKSVFAQGTFDCEWIGLGVVGTCRVRYNSCAPGYVDVPELCSSQTHASCGAVSNSCVPIHGTTCDGLGGHCIFAGSCQYGDILGATDCNASGFRCCADTPSSGGTVGGGPPTTACSGVQGFNTAIGCIPVSSTQAFATFFIRWAMGIAGGIALALIGYSGFMIMSSSGNPQKLQAGKELLTSAITGLLLILFGVFALRFIGVDILQIPGFGT